MGLCTNLPKHTCTHGRECRCCISYSSWNIQFKAAAEAKAEQWACIMAFPYCVTQMYIHNANAHTRSETRGHYKQLFLSLPFKSICLRSAAKGTKSNCFPLNTLDGEWGWEVIMTSPAALPLFSSSSLHPHPLPPHPSISTRLHLCLSWGFWLVLVWLKPDGLHPSPSLSSVPGTELLQ